MKIILFLIISIQLIRSCEAAYGRLYCVSESENMLFVVQNDTKQVRNIKVNNKEYIKEILKDSEKYQLDPEIILMVSWKEICGPPYFDKKGRAITEVVEVKLWQCPREEALNESNL